MGNIVTVTESTIHRCSWCGERIARGSGPGRPRKYCRPSHRQRHYEARREAEARSLGPGEAVFRTEDIGRLRDAIYVLESALQDARQDVADAGTLEAYPAAMQSVSRAVDELLALRWEPSAAG